MPTISSTVKQKAGRPAKDAVSRIRTLFWYSAVRKLSKLSDGKLDLLFYPEQREYVDRVRIFEEIRKTGASISNGTHKRRNFNLLDTVNNYAGLKGTKALYECMFWDVLVEKKPTLKKTKLDLLKIIKTLQLWKIKYKKLDHISDEDVDEIIIGIGLKDVLDEIPNKTKIHTIKSKEYDDILGCICDNSKIIYNINSIKLDSLEKHLNILCLLILLYRYAMFTGNVHLLISCYEFIYSNSSLLISALSWVESKLKIELVNEINIRILKMKRREREFITTDLSNVATFDKADNTLAFNKLLDLMNK